MLSQLTRLSVQADGRYATDAELQFIRQYAKTFNLRLSTYIKVQVAEATIIQQVQDRMRSLDPSLFFSGNEDLTAKWKRDTIRVLRYSAIAMLLNDEELLRDRLLVWMRTIMRAFKAQHSCNITYQVMQTVVREHLTYAEADLLCSILELNRIVLGAD